MSGPDWLLLIAALGCTFIAGRLWEQTRLEPEQAALHSQLLDLRAVQGEHLTRLADLAEQAAHACQQRDDARREAVWARRTADVYKSSSAYYRDRAARRLHTVGGDR